MHVKIRVAVHRSGRSSVLRRGQTGAMWTQASRGCGERLHLCFGTVWDNWVKCECTLIVFLKCSGDNAYKGSERGLIRKVKSSDHNRVLFGPKLTVLFLQTCQIWFCAKYTASMMTVGSERSQWLCLHVQQYPLQLLRLSVNALGQVNAKLCYPCLGKTLILATRHLNVMQHATFTNLFISFNGGLLPIDTQNTRIFHVCRDVCDLEMRKLHTERPQQGHKIQNTLCM